jgi:hypothetical protein
LRSRFNCHNPRFTVGYVSARQKYKIMIHLISQTLISPVQIVYWQKEKRVVFCTGFGTLNAKTCPTSPEIYKFAENLRKRRVDDGRPYRRSWWQSFKTRHPELRAVTAAGVGNVRCEVTRWDISTYFGELKDALA